jgi:hypothetical protein
MKDKREFLMLRNSLWDISSPAPGSAFQGLLRLLRSGPRRWRRATATGATPPALNLERFPNHLFPGLLLFVRKHSLNLIVGLFSQLGNFFAISLATTAARLEKLSHFLC